MTQLDALREEIMNLNLRIKSITTDIHECTGPMYLLDELNQRGRVIKEKIKQCLDDFERIIFEEAKADTKQTLTLEHNRLKDELLFTFGAFKKATVTCTLHIHKTARNELLDGDQNAQEQHRKRKDKEDLSNMSSNVTDRLLSISRTLAETTQRSSDTLGTLVTSSGVVGGTREELDSQGNVISQSGKLLAKYGRREQTDKFLILFAAAFFFACVAYVLQKRLF